MKTWNLLVTITVSDTWVADGFSATPNRVKEALESAVLPNAMGHEVVIKTKSLTAPSKKELSDLWNGKVEPKD